MRLVRLPGLGAHGESPWRNALNPGQSPENATNIFHVAEIHQFKRPSALCPEFSNHRESTGFSSFAANG